MTEFKVSQETSKHAVIGIALAVLVFLAFASKGIFW